ncbi:MAG: hypothetical protein SGPRY_009765, partial [Prymnesium sp.]
EADAGDPFVDLGHQSISGSEASMDVNDLAAMWAEVFGEQQAPSKQVLALAAEEVAKQQGEDVEELMQTQREYHEFVSRRKREADACMLISLKLRAWIYRRRGAVRRRSSGLTGEARALLHARVRHTIHREQSQHILPTEPDALLSRHEVTSLFADGDCYLRAEMVFTNTRARQSSALKEMTREWLLSLRDQLFHSSDFLNGNGEPDTQSHEESPAPSANIEESALHPDAHAPDKRSSNSNPLLDPNLKTKQVTSMPQPSNNAYAVITSKTKKNLSNPFG